MLMSLLSLQLTLIFSMDHESHHSPALLTIFLLAGCLSYSNSAMNPILYAFLSDNFKKSFLKACSCANRRVSLNFGGFINFIGRFNLIHTSIVRNEMKN